MRVESEVAVEASIQVVRAFIRLRELAITHEDLGRRIDEIEKNYDVKFKIIFDTIRKLITPPERKNRKMGFMLEKPDHDKKINNDKK